MVLGLSLPAFTLVHVIISLIAIACFALYGMKLSGVWRPVYIVTAMISLYFNVFVLVFFVVLTIGAWRRYKPMAFA